MHSPKLNKWISNSNLILTWTWKPSLNPLTALKVCHKVRPKCRHSPKMSSLLRYKSETASVAETGEQWLPACPTPKLWSRNYTVISNPWLLVKCFNFLLFIYFHVCALWPTTTELFASVNVITWKCLQQSHWTFHEGPVHINNRAAALVHFTDVIHWHSGHLDVRSACKSACKSGAVSCTWIDYNQGIWSYAQQHAINMQSHIHG